MSTITIPNVDVTSDQVTQALRNELDPQYKVMPGMRIGRSAFTSLQPADPDAIVVVNGIQQAQVTITREAQQTVIRVTPGGLLGIAVINTFGVARKARMALQSELG